MIDALADRGIVSHGRSGLNVWVPVREEAPIVRGLDAGGWRILARERFRLTTPPGVRITTAGLREDEAPRLAAALAAVESAGRPRQLY